MMQLIPRLAAVNIAGLALVGGAASQGWVTDIWNGDSSRLSAVIAALFVFGMVLSFRPNSRQTVRWIGSSLVKLGLVGTVLGFIQALSGVRLDNVADPAAIGPMVAALVAGLGVALYTTLVGAILNLWLSLNLRVIDAHNPS